MWPHFRGPSREPVLKRCGLISGVQVGGPVLKRCGLISGVQVRGPVLEETFNEEVWPQFQVFKRRGVASFEGSK